MDQPELLVDARAEVGEGPVWDERTATLYWVDILAGLVHATDTASGEDRVIDTGQPVGAVTSPSRSGAPSRRTHSTARPELGPPEIFVRLDDDDGMPDGLTADAEGCIWLAIWGGGVVRRYAPDGRLTDRSSCQFRRSRARHSVDPA